MTWPSHNPQFYYPNYLVNKKYEPPRYVIFSSLLHVPPSRAQIFLNTVFQKNIYLSDPRRRPFLSDIKKIDKIISHVNNSEMRYVSPLCCVRQLFAQVNAQLGLTQLCITKQNSTINVGNFLHMVRKKAARNRALTYRHFSWQIITVHVPIVTTETHAFVTLCALQWPRVTLNRTF